MDAHRGDVARSHNILLVEDSEDDALLIARAFRKCGTDCALRRVADGDAAVAYLAGGGAYADRAAHPLPDLILLDLKLPRRSGFEVLAWLRAQPGLRRLPVVVLTGSRQSADIDRAYDAGANSYLMKPVQFDDLQALARALGLFWLVMSERPSVTAAASPGSSLPPSQEARP